MSNKPEWSMVVGAVIVFSLPLTLLIPNFSIWDYVPKIKVTRFHILSQHLTWPQLNAAAIGLLGILFCIYLEIRKRKLDDMVDDVLRVSQATDTTLGVERLRQAVAVRACIELLDASAEHYEHLALLREELRRRDPPRVVHKPPTIEPSTSYVTGTILGVVSLRQSLAVPESDGTSGRFHRALQVVGATPGGNAST